jgi:6-pyruvoyltetrahydropterin/6-carboxytetrahydropterin synthase
MVEKNKQYLIVVKIQFRAGHRLLPPYIGKCNNIHGEGYTAIIFFKSNELDENGMVFDFGDTKRKIKEWINNCWDHSYIFNRNDKMGLILKENGMKVFNIGNQNPTAENMAKYLFDEIKENISDKVCKVGIIESFEDSIAWYEENLE